ncbi:MAG: glycerate kinase, partial [Limisphaerales bacterium]
MPKSILIIPDKFKGTLPAVDAACAIAAGWKAVRPKDKLDLLPMSDGGDGFGEIVADSIRARIQAHTTINAAGEQIEANWWWEPETKTAIVESAKVIGLAMLRPGKFHPFQLDTTGLGELLKAVAEKGAETCIVGLGGSSTNDAGFGMVRALEWKFEDADGTEILKWTDLTRLRKISGPRKKKLFRKLIVAVDVGNPLLGRKGCSRVYGPQKGLRETDFPQAEAALKQLARVARKTFNEDFARIPGAGAAGGLGFAFMAFLRGIPRPGFDIFAENSKLKKRLAKVDIVITAEGALDAQTLMGKGVGQIALLCNKQKIPCIGLAGMVTEPDEARLLFHQTRALVELTSEKNARRQPAKYLTRLTQEVANQLALDS